MQRYECVPWDIRRADMKQNPEGEWVRFDDAQAEIDRLRKVLNNIYENLEYLNTLQTSSKIRAALQRKEGDE